MSVKGFSLMEIMITLIILAIVAAFAIPSYTSYIARTKITKMLESGRSVMHAVAESRVLNGSFDDIIPSDSEQTFINLGIINPMFLNDSISEIKFTKQDDFYMSIVICGSTEGQNAAIDANAVDIYLAGTFYTAGMKWECQYDSESDSGSQYAGSSALVPSTCRNAYDSSKYGALPSTCIREKNIVEPTNVETSLPPYN